MKINQILDELRFVDRSAQIKCCVPKDEIDSKIYVTGQVQPDIPGVVLGEREPYLREKTIGDFIDELTTFGEEFKNNDFLIEASRDIDDTKYELRYYKLTNIDIHFGEVVLNSELSELVKLRKVYESPELE